MCTKGWPVTILVNISAEELKQKFEKTIWIMVVIVYALTGQCKKEVPTTLGWSIIKTPHMAALRL